MPALSLLTGDSVLSKTAVVVIAVAALASFDLFQRMRGRTTHLLFAVAFGSVVSVGLIKILDVFLLTGGHSTPQAMALAMLLVLLGWRALFGPWEASTKASVLGTFIFWAGFVTLLRQSPEERLVTLLAAAVALVPAGVWCLLFLRYHAERAANVAVMFFAGMLSTFPILLYDALVRRGVEFQLFVLNVRPESFSRATRAFVSGQLSGTDAVQTAVVSSLLSFVVVGTIEEISKYWVARRSGQRLFTSIDDALQLSIIVAIGFAFAENVVNPVYFQGFVKDFLLGGRMDVSGFLGSIVGRSVLTSMVHILSTGVSGYFLGLALFAAPYLEERRARGYRYRFLAFMRRAFGVEEVAMFRAQMLVTGLLAAIVLHGAFNFLVTLPEMLPSNPTTLGEMIGRPDTPLRFVPFLLLPSMFYVVGGFWLLTGLFLRKESLEERGHVRVEMVVAD